MSNQKVIFIDEYERTLHEKTLAKLVAEALLYQVRISNNKKETARNTRQPITG